MENLIYNLIEHINDYPRWCFYLFTCMSGWLQVVFPPYPGEVVLVLTGCLQCKSSILYSLLFFLCYWLSIVSANFILYELGAGKGDYCLRLPVLSRYFTEKNKNKIQSWFVRYGFFIYFIAIYIPGMYLPVVFFSGMLKHKRRSALTGIMLATLIHDLILFMGGRTVGGNLKKIALFLSVYRNYVLCIAGAFVVVFIICLFIRHKKQNAHADIM